MQIANKMKIGIFQTGYLPKQLAEKHGQFPQMFEQLLQGHGFTFENYAVVDNQFPQSIHACDGWLITGSAHATYEAHEFIAPLEKFICDAYTNAVPVAGICFGHQIMAQALGGKVEKFSGGWAAGRVKYDVAGKTCKLVAMHQDQVVEKPDDADVIATSEFCVNAGFAYKGAAISFQPHPEFTTEFTSDLIAAKSGKGFSKEIANTALASLGAKDGSSEIAAQLAAFFNSAAKQTAA